MNYWKAIRGKCLCLIRFAIKSPVKEIKTRLRSSGTTYGGKTQMCVSGVLSEPLCTTYPRSEKRFQRLGDGYKSQTRSTYCADSPSLAASLFSGCSLTPADTASRRERELLPSYKDQGTNKSSSSRKSIRLQRPLGGSPAKLRAEMGQRETIRACVQSVSEC